MEIGIRMRKGAMITIRWCFRSICNHPFLVFMLCFLILLHRSSPFIFSLLVSASPVLVCTAVLLGILLSFGNPNIPDIEIEERRPTHEVFPLRRGASEDATVVEKNDSYRVERYTERGWDETGSSTERPSLLPSKLGEVLEKTNLDDTAPLIEERSWESDVEDGQAREGKREMPDMVLKQKEKCDDNRFSDKEVMENHYTAIPKVDGEHIDSDDEKSEADSFDSEKVNVDSLDSPPHSPWRHVEDREEAEGNEDEEEEDDASDSGSDRAESSSPDASMADIMPMLDELHPLLDEDAPQPNHMSREGSDTASEMSEESSTSSHESDEETQKEDLEVAENDNADGEDEVEGKEDKEEQTKSAITWTEEDQKNLMDLGSSELERNQRLENLIMRRRAKKNVSMVPERNLIDLESWDLAFNIPPISTIRQNPFDVPSDSHDNSGLPPIPGSAPSILSQRRNPFDIPYDSSEEKPNLAGGGFPEIFNTFHSREPFFKRHESFNVGPSIFGPSRQERQESRLRPYFIPEQMVSEESRSEDGYSPFQRQSSELSESKVSSVPETESFGSVEDLEDMKHEEEEDNPQELESTSQVTEVNDAVTGLNGEGPLDNPELIPKSEETIVEDVQHEPELLSKIKHVADVGHGSQSSEEEEEELSESDQVEKKAIEVDIELGDIENHYEEGNAAEVVESRGSGYLSHSETSEKRYSRDSSSSSLSEVSEKVFSETELILAGRRNYFSRDLGISSQASIESTTSSLAVEIPHREPVYDLSPPAVRKNFSSSSISSDVHGMSSPPVLVKQTVSFVEKESEGSSRDLEKDISIDTEILLAIHPVNEHESVGVVNKRESNNANSNILRNDCTSESESTSAVPGITSHEYVPSISDPVALDAEILTDKHKQNEIPTSSSVTNVDILVKYSESQSLGESDEIRDSPINVIQVSPLNDHLSVELSTEKEESIQITDCQTQSQTSVSDEAKQDEIPASIADKDVVMMSSEDQVLGQSAESSDSQISDVNGVGVSLPSLQGQLVDGQAIEEQETIRTTESQTHSPSSDSDVYGEASEKLISTPSAEGNAFSVFSDEPINEPRFRHVSEVKAPSAAVQSSNEVQTSQNNVNMPFVQELENGIPSNGDSPLSPDFISIPSSASEGGSSHADIQAIDEVAEEIKEMDEALLSELDNIGDFSVNQWDVYEEHRDSVGGTMSSPHFTRSSSVRIVEVHTLENDEVEEDEIGRTEDSDNAREEIDVCEEDMEHFSGVQTFSNSIAEHVNISSKEFNERDGQDSPDHETSEGETVYRENESSSVCAAADNSNEDDISSVPEGEVHKFDLATSRTDIGSLETEAVKNGAEVSHQSEIIVGTSSAMPELEARKFEDIELAAKKIGDQEIEWPSVVLETSHENVVIGTTNADRYESEKLHENSSSMNLSHEEQNLEVRSTEVAASVHKHISDDSTRSPELPDSDDHILLVVDSKKSQGTSSEIKISPLTDVCPEENPKPSFTDGPLEVQTESMEEKSSVMKETTSVSSEKSDHTVEEDEYPHANTSVKKGKASRSSSSTSSSSSSSESSSSDSDEE